ncbi:MAG TPA: hypothetical protein VKK79_02835 [Candidatus Lokiarchaeia archaeon]|nr:hypothetical protein [Candidatus Lokiarchaeia archaeon]
MAPKKKEDKLPKKEKSEPKAKGEKKVKQKKGTAEKPADQKVESTVAPTDFITPDAAPLVPFFYDQRKLDLNLPPQFYKEKIEEYGFNKVDVHLPGEPLQEELRRFKGLPEESRNVMEKLLSKKSEEIQKRMLIVLQYIFMAAEFS